MGNSIINNIKVIKLNWIRCQLSYFVFILLMFILHWNMSLNVSDDSVFSEVLKNETLLEHISSLYFVENGKVFPDTLAAIFTYINPIIWKICNIFILLIIAVCINKLFLLRNTKLFGCIVVLLFPFSLLTSAGYVATSVNYVWSTAALLVALIPLKYVQQLHTKPVLYVACIFACIYASNQEQSGAILVTVYLIFIIYSICTKRKIYRYIWIQFIISILGVVFVFSAPGHIKRSQLYTIFNQPDFLTLDFFEKLIRGFTSTSAVIITGQYLIWPLLCLMLLLVIWIRRQEIYIRLLAVIPVLSSLCLGVFQDYMPMKIRQLFSFYPSWGYSMPDYMYIDASTYTQAKYYIPLFISLILLGLVILEIFWAFGNELKGIIIFLTFSAGICTRVIMGFSPTLYGSIF